MKSQKVAGTLDLRHDALRNLRNLSLRAYRGNHGRRAKDLLFSRFFSLDQFSGHPFRFCLQRSVS